MITMAGKYADVRAVTGPSARGRVGTGAGSGVIGPSRRLPSIPVLPEEQRVPTVAAAAMAGRAVQTFGRTEERFKVQGSRFKVSGDRTVPSPSPRPSPQGRGSSGLQILVPKRAVMIRWDEWMWRELREGGYLKRYYAQEKGMATRRQRAVARKMGEFKQNYRSDLELRAAIPAREFFRWKNEDKDFWRDDSNLRSLKRDNPEMCIYGV